MPPRPWLYRAKDTIERDFRVIKDLIELRPLYHHTDQKVRAHVTICMLALLLKRELEARLEAAGHRLSAAEALDRLGACHLLRYEEHEALSSIYSTTRPTADQRTLLAALGMQELTDDRRLAEWLPHRDI